MFLKVCCGFAASPASTHVCGTQLIPCTSPSAEPFPPLGILPAARFLLGGKKKKSTHEILGDSFLATCARSSPLAATVSVGGKARPCQGLSLAFALPSPKKIMLFCPSRKKKNKNLWGFCKLPGRGKARTNQILFPATQTILPS